MIREAKIEDAEAILPLFHQLWPNRQIDSDETVQILGCYIEDGNYEIYCYEDEKIEGIITVSIRQAFFYDGSVAIIEDLVINKYIRGEGIGSELVRFVERKLKEKGISSIELSSDFHRAQAHDFWEKLEYKKSGYHFRKFF
jgi:N-acetylglutamate synthase-like GNAT family acetyltransferase